ncbi:butyrophilin-like protein 9 [Pleuronectes platessa]|uniref:butyrophilin-like protein 9 n=1 Tax=Pleuronectes platessa TaxID=8262 RepID=UPI00232A78BC|nr:butyrophilin-like protein 9 [Pleuronectes platessa]
MSASVMDARLVLLAALLAALLSTCSDSRETSDDGLQKIYASAGEAVVLPCEINRTDGDNPTVEWATGGPVQKIYTFVYRDHFEDSATKNKDFKNRTSLFMNEVDNGNFSLRILNVRPSDAGKHECSNILDNKLMVITTLELIVCAAPEPKLSVVDVETVQCEVNSSLPYLNMTFLDHQEKIIDHEEPKRHPDSSGCFNFTGRVKVPTATDRITCRVHQPQTNQSRDVQIYFTANCTMSCAVWSSVAAVVAFAVGIGLGFLGSAGRKTPPLDLQLQEKERINSELREELKDIRSTQSPVTRQPNQSAFDVSPTKPSPDILNVINPHQFPNGNNPKPGASSNSNHSNSGSLSQEKDTKPGVRKQTAAPDRPLGIRRSPSLSLYHGSVSSDPSQDSFSENEPLRRSKSLSERLNVNGAKFKTSAGTLNRYSVLADLAEDPT